MRVDSQLVSLADLLDRIPAAKFSVPIYQRLYVWGNDQVRTLLEDLCAAMEKGSDIFYLGGVLVRSGGNGAEPDFELIDGQQRFTTLWLLAAAWRGALLPFMASAAGIPRLHFRIRDEANNYLKRICSGGVAEVASSGEQLAGITNALELMRAFPQSRAAANGNNAHAPDLEALTRFIFRNVKFLFCTVPGNTDLNKLFEIINNRGVQLRHHEVLKAKMLDALHDDERGRYAALWNACADMDNYLERSLARMTAVRPGSLFDAEEATTDKEPLADADAVLTAMSNDESGRPLQFHSLGRILGKPPASDCGDDGANEPHDNAPPREGERVRSILGFPLLLQHVLRIWLWEHRTGDSKRDDLPRIADRELLHFFGQYFFRRFPAEGHEDEGGSRRDGVVSFLKLLWEVRYLFDKHVIKWVGEGDDELHLIKPIRYSKTRQGNGYLGRDADESAGNRGFSLLQSMLYHSQQITTQYWLTPLLHHMHKAREGADAYYDFLRQLDNALLCSVDDRSLMERTRELGEEQSRWNNEMMCAEAVLTSRKGVGFSHYLFYKLDFILWYQGSARHCVMSHADAEKWKQFRFTAKNSVEHVSPQNPSADDTESRDFPPAWRDRFGNLALVSRGVNSEFGAKPFREKRAHFQTRLRAKLDSQKMYLIYRHETWDNDLAAAHENAMVAAFSDYLEDPANRPGARMAVRDVASGGGIPGISRGQAVDHDGIS